MIKELSYVIAIAEKGNVSKAAESLFISQPSLSKYLKNLEDHLGAPLFNRRDGGYYPTYLGERYLHYAKRIVAYGDEWNREHDDITHRKCTRTWRRIYPASTKSCPAACGWAARC